MIWEKLMEFIWHFGLKEKARLIRFRKSMCDVIFRCYEIYEGVYLFLQNNYVKFFKVNLKLELLFQCRIATKTSVMMSLQSRT